MINFICICGLPGSGKTTYANSHVKDGEVVVDDITNIGILKELLKSNFKTIYITDPNFCFNFARVRAEEELNKIANGCNITWIYFEKDIDKCLKNIQYRNDGRNITIQTLKHYAKHYNPPKDALKIWQNND